MRRDDRIPARRPAPADWLAAVGHPLRVEILHHFLTARTATPSEIASALGLPVGTVSYHVRVLTGHGPRSFTTWAHDHAAEFAAG